MLAEHLRIWGLLIIALCFWLIPACYPLKKHEQGISLGISLTATLALLHYSKRQIQEEILEQNYQLMEDELLKTELAYSTYHQEQLIQQRYTTFEAEVLPPEAEVLPGSTSTHFHPLPGSTSTTSRKYFPSLPGSTSPSSGQAKLSKEDKKLLLEIQRLRANGLTPTAIVKQIWKTSSGRSFQKAMAQYKRLVGES